MTAGCGGERAVITVPVVGLLNGAAKAEAEVPSTFWRKRLPGLQGFPPVLQTGDLG